MGPELVSHLLGQLLEPVIVFPRLERNQQFRGLT
jgi:hypothetical protein